MMDLLRVVVIGILVVATIAGIVVVITLVPDLNSMWGQRMAYDPQFGGSSTPSMAAIITASGLLPIFQAFGATLLLAGGVGMAIVLLNRVIR